RLKYSSWSLCSDANCGVFGHTTNQSGLSLVLLPGPGRAVPTKFLKWNHPTPRRYPRERLNAGRCRVARRSKALAISLLMALAGTAADGQEREKLPALQPVYSAADEKTTAIRFSPDGRILALGGPATVRILSTDSFRETKRLAQQGLVDELVFDSSGKHL